MLKYFSLLIVCFSLTACFEQQNTLLYNVSQDNANQVILLLGQADITATKVQQKDNTFNVMVNNSSELKALNILSTSGSPRNQYQSLGEVFKKDGFISSPLEEHARLEFAINQQISSMLADIDGIISIKTAIGLPELNTNIWQETPDKPTASVFIKYSQGSRLYMYTNQIKSLVSHAVPGLTADQVDVMMIEVKNDFK